MRFYTERCPRRRGVVSDRFVIVDTDRTLHTIDIDERDAEFVCAALNAAARQEALCDV